MGNIRIVGPALTDPDGVPRKKDIYTRTEAEDKFVAKVNGAVPPANTTTVGGVKLPSGIPDYSSDPITGGFWDMYKNFSTLGGTAETPYIPGLVYLWKVFHEWTSDTMTAVDNGDGTQHWIVNESALDPATLAKINAPQKWSSEILAFSTTTSRETGYGEGTGGVTVDAPITLKSVFVRVPGGFSVGGTGDLRIDIYAGTATVVGGLLFTIFMAAGLTSIKSNVPGNPVDLLEDAVLRAYITKGSTSGMGLQIQYRGVYK